MTCNNCKSNKIIDVSAKCNDMCSINYDILETDGYVPFGLNIGGGDYIDFEYCGNCGMIQSNNFPIKEQEIIESIWNQHED